MRNGQWKTEMETALAALARENDGLKRAFAQVERIKTEWERSMDCVEEMVIVADERDAVRRCNQTLKEFVGLSYQEILGTNWIDLLADCGMSVADLAEGVEVFHPGSGRWFSVNRHYYRDAGSGTVITIADITQLKRFMQELEMKNLQIESSLQALQLKNVELEKTYAALKSSQAQMIHQEKMASIGQLAAGVAHEINNPIGFVSSNLTTLEKYVMRLTEFINDQSDALATVPDLPVSDELRTRRKTLKLDFIVEDIKSLISESLDGIDRVSGIVRDLKSFSRMDEQEITPADINECIESALNIVWNELKYKVVMKKEFGAVRSVHCNPRQLNQVFMNLLVNAAQAIEKQGEITIRTWSVNDSVYASVSDTGCGIPAETLGRIFEPFFTTKEVGKGTGLGLSISYDIIKKHCGEISVDSVPGKGTTFTVRFPAIGEEQDGRAGSDPLRG